MIHANSCTALLCTLTTVPYQKPLLQQTMFLCKVWDAKLSNVFEKYGVFIATHPWWIIALSLTLNILLASHMIGFRFNTDLEQLYTPTNSQADRDRELVQQLFSDRSRSNFYAHSCNDINRHGSVIITTPHGVNILNESFRNEIFEIHQKIINITVKYDDLTYNYRDLCGMRNGSCVIDGDAVLSNMFWENVGNGSKQFLGNMYEGFLSLDQWMGGIEMHIDTIVFAKALKLTYNLRQDSKYKNISTKWEKEFIKIGHTSQHLKTVYAHSDSLNSELNDNTENDIKFFALSFTIAITYISFVTAGGNCVSQRGWLGRGGVLCAVFSTFAAFGLASGIRIAFVNIIGIMPFLIVGISVNNMLIFMSTLADAPLEASSETRIGLTLRTAGVAVTLTFLTDVVVFTGGLFSVFMVVRSFCIFSVVAITLVYVNTMTFFIACMTLHEKRVNANRHCLTCKQMLTAEERKTNGGGCCMTCFCSGSAAASRNEQESIFEKVPRSLLPRLVLWKPTQFLILVVFIVSFGFAVWGTVHFKEGFVPQDLLSTDSYFLEYVRLDQKYFSEHFIMPAVFPKMMNYNTAETFLKIEQLETAINLDRNVDTTKHMNWYADFYNDFTFPPTEQGFADEASTSFLRTHPWYSNDITFDEHNLIKASRIFFRTSNLQNTYDQGQLLKRLRRIATDSMLDVIIYCPHFVMFEQYTALPRDLVLIMSVSIGALLVVTCVLFNHPLSAIFVTVTEATILCGLVGFLYFWEVVFTPITIIHLLVAIGLSVEFSVHFCHAFDSMNGSRCTRVNDAIARAGVPLFNVAVALLIGICMLIAAKSYVFVSLFKIIILAISFGVVYSVCVLPVFLSFCGWPTVYTKSAKSISTNSTDQSISDDNLECELSLEKDNLAFKYPETEIYSVKL